MAAWTPREQLYAGLSQPGYWTFSAGEVAQILGIPRRRVAFYVDEGIIEALSPVPRPGFARKFGIIELQLFEAFRQLEQLGTAPRYLKQIQSEVRRLVEDYSCHPLPAGVERVYPTPQEEISGQYPGSLILVWKDEQQDRLCARDLDYSQLAGEDCQGGLGLTGFALIDLRALLETTYNRACDYAQIPGGDPGQEEGSPSQEGGRHGHRDAE